MTGLVKTECFTRIALRGVEQTPRHHGFCRGVATLLNGIERKGSLQAAAREIGTSYSKAWHLIKNAEAEFSCTLATRAPGNGSVLTKEGRKLLALYQEANQAAELAAQEVVESKLSGLGKKGN